MIYEIDYELYCVLLQDYQENITDYRNKSYLLNCFIIYEKNRNKYICVNNTVYHWKITEFNTLEECINWFIAINFKSDDIKRNLENEMSYYRLVKSFIKTKKDFINKYEKYLSKSVKFALVCSKTY